MEVYAAARKLSALTLDPTAVNLPAKPPPQDLQYRHARSLLVKVLHKLPNKPLWSQEPQAQYARQLSKSTSACNVSLITAAGVEFRIHSRMLVNGPKFLEEWLVEDGVYQQQECHAIALPRECHPILVDRFISFLYTEDYDIPPSNGLLYSDNGTCNLRNAFHIPNLPTPEATALIDAPRHTFHLHMYALAERLHYSALRTAARNKLWAILHDTMRPSTATGARWMLCDCIDACFAPLGSDARLCADGDGLLRESIVAAVLAHEVRTWNKAQRNGLRTYLSGPQYDGFWTVYNGVTAENAELLAPVSEAAGAGQLRDGAKIAQSQARKGVRADEAQKRRDRKEQFRKGWALIEEQEAGDLAIVMAANPIEAQDVVVHEHKQSPVEGFQLPLPAMALAYRTRADAI